MTFTPVPTKYKTEHVCPILYSLQYSFTYDPPKYNNLLLLGPFYRIGFEAVTELVSKLSSLHGSQMPSPCAATGTAADASFQVGGREGVRLEFRKREGQGEEMEEGEERKRHLHS